MVDQFNQVGDAKVYKFFSTPIVGMGCASHPNIAQHQAMAYELGKVIASVMGW